MSSLLKYRLLRQGTDLTAPAGSQVVGVAAASGAVVSEKSERKRGPAGGDASRKPKKEDKPKVKAATKTDGAKKEAKKASGGGGGKGEAKVMLLPPPPKTPLHSQLKLHSFDGTHNGDGDGGDRVRKRINWVFKQTNQPISPNGINK
jgi:hypothetical protein